MFLRQKIRRKDGKEHRTFSVVENKRVAGGPGGQHQNKTASAVRAVHNPTGLAVLARDGRSQHRNKAIALKRLSALLELSEELARLSHRI